jgi:hypothetical protein
MHISFKGKLNILYYGIFVILYSVASYLLFNNLLSTNQFFGIVLGYMAVFGVVYELAQTTAKFFIRYKIQLIVILDSAITLLTIIFFATNNILQMIAYGVIVISILVTINIISWNAKRNQSTILTNKPIV